VKIYVPPTHAHLTPELLTAADSLWTEAEACLAKDPTLLDRVRRARMSVDYAIVEQGRAVAKTPAQKRTAVQNRQLELARTRFTPFTTTLAASKLTRIREWKDVDKTAYAQTLAADLGISSPGKSHD